MIVLVAVAFGADFTSDPPGKLQSGGQGYTDPRVWIPEMRFPLEEAEAYANSQVYGHGGSAGPAGSAQCDAANYTYPWRDDYCEARQWDMPLCPGGKGHQGQDIRPATCKKDEHWAVAAETGTISHIGTYSVSLVSDTGNTHRYLHLEPSSLVVKEGQHVARGEHIGKVSNYFGGTATTIHLHYDVRTNVAGVGNVYVPPYSSLVAAYQALLGQAAAPCAPIPANGRTVDDAESCARLFGNPTYWRSEPTQGIGGLHWTNAYTGAMPSNYARWDLTFAEAGRYRLAVNVLPAFAMSKQARYVVERSGGADTVTVDQTAATDGWVTLGEFDFDAGAVRSVTLQDNTGEPSTAKLRLMFDSLRVEHVEPPVVMETTPPAPPVGPPDPSPPNTPVGAGTEKVPVTAPTKPVASGPCGCGAGGPAGAWALLLAMGLAARRRR